MVVTSADYHADPRIGSSMIEDFWRSRELYHGRYIAGTIERVAETPAMLVGSAIHCRVLEPKDYWERYTAAPMHGPDGEKWNRAKKTHKESWRDFLEHAADRVILTPEQDELVVRVADAVLSHPLARSLVRVGQPEKTIFWTDAETGLQCKCRVDALLANCIVDLKTTSDASPNAFAKACANYGYHRRRAHYLAGVRAETGEEPPFFHIAAQTQPPWQVAVYDLEDYGTGVDQWRQALDQIAECHRTKDWRDPWTQRVMRLDLPKWANFETDWRV